MFIIDYYSSATVLLSLILTVLFFLHSRRILKGAQNLQHQGSKDDDDYVSGKKYNEQIGKLHLTLEDTRNRMVSFVEWWRGILFAYVVIVALVLYWGFVSKVQIIDRLENLEERMKRVEGRIK